jgi:post-segregation antitoxin (ccd killing protein)
VTHYDPEVPPDPAQWLALDEQERIQLAEAHHRATRVKLPNSELHAVFHTIVENQIAEGLASVTRAMERLAKQGLSRHDAIHAVSSVCAEHLFETLKSKDLDLAATTQARYEAAVERLTANSWREQYGENDRDA